MAAITGSLMAALKAGDHAVVPYTVYGGTHEFLKEFAQVRAPTHAPHTHPRIPLL